MITKKHSRLLAIILILGVLLVACQPEEVVVEVPVEVTRVVTETIEEAGEQVEVTRIVTEEVIVEVPAEPEPAEEVMLTDETPDTYVHLTFGDIGHMDPNLVYDTATGQLIDNVMEPLITYNHKDGTTYVPALATEVPSLENGGISEDGSVFTFNIREGVTFHAGGTLEPHDVAYSFQRGLLQSDPNSAQWLLFESFYGPGSHDIAENIAEGEYSGDPEALAANVSAEELVALCEGVMEKIVADDAAGTVTMTLHGPWGPFLATIAQSWGSILDMEWVIEQGGWDGSCDTWQNYYSPGTENTELASVINGTGPYMLDHWTPGEEYVLVAYPNYWRTEPKWEGGPSGVARIQTVVVRLVDEWGTRFAALQAGDAESVAVNPEDRPQVDPLVGEECDWITDECTPTDNPDGPFRAWRDLPSVSKSHVFFTWNVAEGSTYVGSGQLDGNGVPLDFFSDVNVRRGISYCFDHETFIAESQNGEGVRTNGPIIRDMLGYNEDGPQYDFDLEACEAELAQAWGGVLPETGFRFSAGFNTGNSQRQTAAEILQTNLASINPNYQVDVVGLPWPTFLNAFFASQIPLLTSGWVEDIHDPHNWAQPFTIGTYGGRQGLPQDVLDMFDEVVTGAVSTSDPAEREELYFQMQQMFYDQAVSIPLSQQTGTRYELRWVSDWYNRVGAFGLDFYAYGLDG
jgi:peptide/nickel transport system substrate-binding protein